MFGTGLLTGMGVTLKHMVDTFLDDRRQTPSRYTDSVKMDDFGRRMIHQPVEQEGLLTIQYPEERRLLPERFRYIPMLIFDTKKNEDLCTACGICAKVCPPQCIWIVRDMDAAGKPVARPAEFFIDVAVCMSCSFCTEFCPFDAIKMNHDFELATYDRYPQLVYDKAELTVPEEYYAALWPTQFAQEAEVRRLAEEADRAKAAAKVKAEAEKVARAASGEDAKPKRNAEELKALAQQKAAARKAGGAEAETVAVAEEVPAISAEEAAKKARIDEMKRKAQEASKKRKEGGE